MRALLDAMPDLMIRFRRDGTYVDIRGDTSGLVRPREEMIGRNVRDFLPARVVDELMRAARSVRSDAKRRRRVEYELEVDGERRRLRGAHGAERGRRDRLRSSATSRSRAGSSASSPSGSPEVQHEQTFTRTVVNTAPIVLMLCDEQGGIVRFNDTTERLTGHRRRAVWGRSSGRSSSIPRTRRLRHAFGASSRAAPRRSSAAG